MPIVIDAVEARVDRKSVTVKGFTQTQNEADSYFATLYMGAAPASAAKDLGSASDDKSLPQAYLVEQPADACVPPHFHDTDQFQLFIDGQAQLGKQTVNPLSLHYAGGHTPYGPIVTTDQGVHYLTLRAKWDAGGKPMPASRDKLKSVPRVHRTVDDIRLDTQELDHVVLLAVEQDGLGASLFHFARQQTRTLDLATAGAGQYAIVVAGSVRHEQKILSPNSCLYRFSTEDPLTLTAMDDAASVVLLQFPIH